MKRRIKLHRCISCGCILKRKFKTNRNKNGLVFRLVDTRPHTLEEVKKKISEVRKYYEEMGVPVMSFDEILEANKDVLKRLKEK